MTFTRRQDWPERLIDTIARHAAIPFTWGVSDCLTMPLACVAAMTDVLPWASEHGETDAIGARTRLRAHGFRNVADALASLFPEIPVPLAGRGDLGVIETPDAVSGVVFVGLGAIGKDAADAGGTGGSGNRRVARALVTRAFKVG